MPRKKQHHPGTPELMVSFREPKIGLQGDAHLCPPRRAGDTAFHEEPSDPFLTGLYAPVAKWHIWPHRPPPAFFCPRPPPLQGRVMGPGPGRPAHKRTRFYVTSRHGKLGHTLPTCVSAAPWRSLKSWFLRRRWWLAPENSHQTHRLLGTVAPRRHLDSTSDPPTAQTGAMTPDHRRPSMGTSPASARSR